MRLPRHFWILHATSIAAVVLACGINDLHDANPADVNLRTYQDMNGDIPPFAGNLGTTYFLDKAGWNCLIHPYATEPPFDEDDERTTRVVVHELGHTLDEPGTLAP